MHRMNSPELERYLRIIVRQVWFRPDRTKIYEELLEHSEDLILHLRKQGVPEEQLALKCMESMGDAKLIGKELNKQHSVVLGWVYVISQTLVVCGVCFYLYLILGSVIVSISGVISPGFSNLKDSDFLYTIPIEQERTIDDTVITFQKLAVGEDGNLYLYYKTRNRLFQINAWSLSTLGTITDEFGTTYYPSSTSSGGIVTHGILYIEDFSPEARTLFIDYDWYNRKYHVEISLPENWRKAGDST